LTQYRGDRYSQEGNPTATINISFHSDWLKVININSDLLALSFNLLPIAYCPLPIACHFLVVSIS
jgi:hypothetical protein